MVAKKDDHGLVEESHSFEIVEESTDLVVEISHLGVVKVGDVVQTWDVVEVVVQVLGKQGVRGPALEFFRDERVSNNAEEPAYKFL